MKLIQKGIIKKDDKFLILLRSSKAEFLPEYWDFPGGKLEKGEDPHEGIEREILEETGLIVKAGKIIGIYEFTLKDIPHRFTLYDTTFQSKDITLSDEHTDYKWVTKEEILKISNREPYFNSYFEKNL